MVAHAMVAAVNDRTNGRQRTGVFMPPCAQPPQLSSDLPSVSHESSQVGAATGADGVGSRARDAAAAQTKSGLVLDESHQAGPRD
jgi:hypothetical protein